MERNAETAVPWYDTLNRIRERCQTKVVIILLGLFKDIKSPLLIASDGSCSWFCSNYIALLGQVISGKGFFAII